MYDIRNNEIIGRTAFSSLRGTTSSVITSAKGRNCSVIVAQLGLPICVSTLPVSQSPSFTNRYHVCAISRRAEDSGAKHCPSGATSYRNLLRHFFGLVQYLISYGSHRGKVFSSCGDLRLPYPLHLFSVVVGAFVPTPYYNTSISSLRRKLPRTHQSAKAHTVRSAIITRVFLALDVPPPPPPYYSYGMWYRMLCGNIISELTSGYTFPVVRAYSFLRGRCTA